ncbi:MAG: hypothetical protein ACRDRV_11130, partial [Pseudonocardiaceae bacterium]
MSDDLGLFRASTEDQVHSPGRRRARERRPRPRRRGVLIAALIVLVLTVGAVGYGVRELITLRQVPDYEGAGGAELIVQIEEGESLSA